MDCQLCCWSEAELIFDDSEYSLPPKNTMLYEWYEMTGYNHVINNNSFNSCNVCYECLIEKIYNCDIHKKNCVLDEMMRIIELKNACNYYNIPQEIFKVIYNWCKN